MEIPQDPAINETTRILEGMKIDEVSADKVAPDVNAEFVNSCPSESVNAEQGGTRPVLDPPIQTFGKELAQHPVSVSLNVAICPQGATLTGYPLPVVNTHGYVPYPMGGLMFENPVGQFAPVYIGSLDPAQAVSYPQVFYPQYPVSTEGCHAVGAPLHPEAGTMIPEVPNPIPFMPNGFPYPYTSHFGPMAMMEPPSGLNHVPDIIQNPLAPIWVQQPVYSIGPMYEGNFVPPHLNHAMPCNGVWPQGQWQYSNASEPLKALKFKNRRPEKLDIISKASMQNLPDFSIDFNDAKHFIIKSFSEENVWRSVEHGVWTSTFNGNKKLDGAYQDAQRRAEGKAKGCPVFLYFSVNGSGRFCGVAEMVGPVDYDNSKDFWEQSRWCGSFPVKWCIIKEVPNSYLRWIHVKNNESKPVTSSRDTQEVNFEEGMQMLKIMKSYPSKASVRGNLSSPFIVLPEGKLQQVLPSSEKPKQVIEQPNEASEELAKGLALEESNALKTCNGEAKGQKKPIKAKKDGSLMEDYGGGRKQQQVDKENVMVPGVDMPV